MHQLLKAALIGLYLLALAGRFIEMPGNSAAVLQRVAVIVVLVHGVELLFAWRHVKTYRGSLVVSVLLTLLFGLFHWRPLAQAAHAARAERATRAPSGAPRP